MSANWGYLPAVAKVSDPPGCAESRLSNLGFQQYVNILLLDRSAFVPESNRCSVSFPPPSPRTGAEARPLFSDGQHCWGRTGTCLCLAVLDRGISAAVIAFRQSSPHLPRNQNKPWYDNQPFFSLELQLRSLRLKASGQ